MRKTGAVDAPPPLGANDHVCWSYTTRAEFTAAAVSFLAEGLALGYRVHYVDDAGTEQLRDELAGIKDLDRLVDEGTILISTLQDVYGQRDPSGRQQVDAYADATAAALRAGYEGLRVAAGATSLVSTPARLAEFAVYEHLVDQFMTGHPFSALCGYDSTRLGEPAVAELACLHPLVRSGSTPFQLFAGDSGGFRLRGEIDLFCRRLFEGALGRALSQRGEGTIEIDADALTFMDHHGLIALDRYARLGNAKVVLHTKLNVLSRLQEILKLGYVRVERLA